MGAAGLALLAGAADADGKAGDFDFYVVSLSWSPTWCGEQGGRGDPEQCDAKVPFGFILHGFWPQYETGYPQSCQTRFSLRIPRSVADDMNDLMPTDNLVFHEWRKHGTCSGDDPQTYFAKARRAARSIRIPDMLKSPEADRTAAPIEIERAFTSANIGLPINGIAVTCSGGALDEVRICMTRDLRFRACPEVDRRACRASNITIPAAH